MKNPDECTGGPLIDYTYPNAKHMWVSHEMGRIFMVENRCYTYGSLINYCPICGKKLREET